MATWLGGSSISQASTVKKLGPVNQSLSKSSSLNLAAPMKMFYALKMLVRTHHLGQ